MHPHIGRTLSSFELGEAQVHANMAVLPILLPGNGLDYLTMHEALAGGLLQVQEVSEGGLRAKPQGHQQGRQAGAPP